jgi:Kinesin motor domain
MVKLVVGTFPVVNETVMSVHQTLTQVFFHFCLLSKTYTMEGTQEVNQYGISYRTIQKVFHLLNLRSQQQRAAAMFVGNDEVKEEVSFSFKLQVGMLEIYNDEIYDLLATSGSSVREKKEEAMKAGGKSSLEIRRDKDGRVEVPNLTKENVTSISEVMTLLKRGNSNRATASTDLNEHSSRSHMVLSVDVESGLGKSSMNKGTLYLVDLAGSERVRKSNVEGENLKEAGFINKSLSALGNVMEALDRRASHIPYRDSKLTSLLQNALGGNSRTMMVVTTCPVDAFFDESVHALQFATRVRRIQIGAAQRNVSAKNLEETVKALTSEMLALTRAKERTEGQLLSLKRDNDRVQEKLQNISNARSQGRTDNKTLDILRKNNDDLVARWEKEKSAREESNEELEKSRKDLRMTQQQLNRFKSKLEQLEQKLEDKEHALERASDELRTERNRKSAANVRSRRDEVLNSRAYRPTIAIQPPSSAIPSPSRLSNVVRKTPTNQAAGGSESVAGTDAEVAKIRSQVLLLLEKHDKSKVDRIDIIMEKFKGKEALLLEKMTQRYQASSNGTSAAQSGSSLASRNELALQRHQERMKRIHEKRAATQGKLSG